MFNNLHIDDAKTPYHAVQHLLLDLLELELDAPHQHREHILCQSFKDQYILTHLSLLNDFLHIKVMTSFLNDPVTVKVLVWKYCKNWVWCTSDQKKKRMAFQYLPTRSTGDENIVTGVYIKLIQNKMYNILENEENFVKKLVDKTAQNS